MAAKATFNKASSTIGSLIVGRMDSNTVWIIKEIIVLKQNSLFIILYPKINNGIFINKLIIPNVFNDFGKTKNLCIK